jgi:N-acetylneuraminic acid mutarotase
MKYFILLVLLTAQGICFSQLWTQKANFGGIGRHRSFGISIGNKGYIGTGHVNGTGTNISYKDWWQYDPSSNSWTQKADYPVGNYGVVGWGTATRGYAGGGAAYSNQMHEYNPVTNTWTAIANCPFAIGEIQAFGIQGKGYVFGASEFAEYSPTTNSWAVKANYPSTLGTWSCSFATSTSGFTKSGYGFYEYKPASDTWLPRASFPGISSSGSSAFSINEKGYVVCGYYSGLSNVTDEVWEFNPGINSWTIVTSFPGTNRRFPVAFSIGNIGYLGTGTNGINMNDFWQFYHPVLSEESLKISAQDILVYPQPAIEKVTIKIQNINQQELLNCQLILYASNGEEIKNIRIVSDSIEIEREELNRGVYFYLIKDSEKVIYSGKLVFN